MDRRPTAVFFGSPGPAIPALRALAAQTDVTAVVTRPDAVRGRGRRILRTPVALEAEALGLPIATPERRADLAALDLDVDLAVVVAFGMIIPGDVLARPRRGFLNIHFSLLPRWRGAAPVERAILAGDAETGVALMQMDEGLDTGPVFAERAIPVGRSNAGELTDILAGAGADLLTMHLPSIIDGSATATRQEGEVTYAEKLAPSEGRLAVHDETDELDRRIRAFTPRPGAFFETDQGRLKVWSAEPVRDDLEPGEWRQSGGDVFLGTGDGALRLFEVQAEGSRRMDAAAWANGRRGVMPGFQP